MLSEKIIPTRAVSYIRNLYKSRDLLGANAKLQDIQLRKGFLITADVNGTDDILR